MVEPCSLFPASDICPDAEQNTRAFLARLPRGRAWGNHDGGPFPDSILYKFWRGIGGFYTFINDRICAAFPEFFCARAVETQDWWLEEYGLPDGCDPFPDACAKILWRGTPRCEHFIASAARAGWAILTVDAREPCAFVVGADQAGCAQVGPGFPPGWEPGCVDASTGSGLRVGCDQVGDPWAQTALGLYASDLLFRVSLEHSPSYPGEIPPLAGIFCAGDSLGCTPDLSGLVCLMARIVPAHIRVIYEVLT